MNYRQLFISIAIVTLSCLGLYLLITPHLQQPPLNQTRESPQPSHQGVTAKTVELANQQAAQPSTATTGDAGDHIHGGRKTLVIFGRIVDADRQPVENALIAEERYFHTAHSDRDGNYRILLDIPRHRYPTLHFLRSGYDGKRVRFKQKQLEQSPIYRLDVSLDDALNSVSLHGWVGNEFGVGLEGAHVELAASYSRNHESFYLTSFTDVNGNFDFEGVRSDETYKFSVNLAPKYPYYENLDFRITQNPAQVNIVLKKLRLVDIDGMIVNRESIPIPDYEIYLSNVTTGAHNRKIVSDSSGYFSLANFPLGEIKLSTRGSEFYRITGLRINETGYQNLEIVVDRGDNYLSGWVSDANGIAVNRAMVTLDRKFERGEVQHSSYRSQATDNNGGFAFDHLGDGEYHVTVYALDYQKQEFNYRFNSQSDEILVTLKRN